MNIMMSTIVKQEELTMKSQTTARPSSGIRKLQIEKDKTTSLIIAQDSFTTTQKIILSLLPVKRPPYVTSKTTGAPSMRQGTATSINRTMKKLSNTINYRFSKNQRNTRAKSCVANLSTMLRKQNSPSHISSRLPKSILLMSFVKSTQAKPCSKLKTSDRATKSSKQPRRLLIS